MVHNSMEDTVKQFLDDILSREEFRETCRCESCTDDIMAYALNHLKPMYCTSIKGAVYGKYNATEVQNQMDVYRVIINAIEMVSENKHI